MNAETKVIKHKLSVLELAEALGNVSAACRQRGVSRTQLYDYKRRFQTHGMEGLRDLPPIAKHHPNTTPPETVEKIKGLAMTHPSRGPNYLESLLKADGIQISFVTIQKILEREGLGSRYDRWLAIEKRQAEQPFELTAEQIAFIEKQNPQFKERHVESGKPGELLNQDTFLVGSFKRVGRVYMHVVVDTWCNYAFGFMHVSKQAEASVAVLYNNVLPFYQKHKLSVENILTDNGREFCGTEQHPYELYLELNDIKHHRTKVRHPQTNGFVERFNRTMLDEFFKVMMREKVYSSLESLQTDFDQWLQFYNEQRPHLGYRNHGKKPMERILDFKKLSSQVLNNTYKQLTWPQVG